MATVIEDLAVLAPLSENSQGEITTKRVFHVKGVNDATVTDRPVTAYNAVSVGVGDNHPNATLAALSVKCVNKTVKMIDVTQFQVTCEYSTPASTTGSSVVDTGSVVEISGSSVEQETNQGYSDDSVPVLEDMVLGTLEKWQYGHASYAEFTKVVDIGGDNRPHVYESRGSTPTTLRPKDDDGTYWTDEGLEQYHVEKSEQNVLVNKFTPIFKLRCSRIETSNPAANIRDYTGKINDANVSIAGVTWTARKLLCESITSSTDDEGDTYSVTYNFLYKFDGWDITAIYKDENGFPAADYEAMNSDTANSGSNTFKLYEEEDFDALNLDDASA